jgi:hypothetical protein
MLTPVEEKDAWQNSKCYLRGCSFGDDVHRLGARDGGYARQREHYRTADTSRHSDRDCGRRLIEWFHCQNDQLCLHWAMVLEPPTVKAIITFAHDDGSGATTAPQALTTGRITPPVVRPISISPAYSGMVGGVSGVCSAALCRIAAHYRWEFGTEITGALELFAIDNAKLNKSLAAGCTHTLHDGHGSFLAITNLGLMLLRFAVKSLAEEWLSSCRPMRWISLAVPSWHKGCSNPHLAFNCID